jgi:hypothetical protein
MGMPSYGIGFGMERMNGKYAVSGEQKPGGGYGKELKGDIRYYWGMGVHMSGRGEAIAFKDSYCEIDPNVVDKYGIPVLRFHTQWSQNEINQAKHMKETSGNPAQYGSGDHLRK